MRGFAVRWPFRRKLNLLVGVPLTLVAVLLAYLIADQTAQSRNAADAARLVRESAEVATLVDRLAAEHQQAVLLSVRHEAAEGNTPSSAAYRTARSLVDAQVERVRDAFGDALPESEAQALRGVEGLSSLRETVEQQYLPAENIDPAYTHAAQGLIDGLGLDRNPDLASTFTGNLLDSLLRAGLAHSAFETGVFSASTGDSNALLELIGAIGSYDEYTHQADRFARFATDAQAAQLNGIKYTAAQSVVSRQFAELQIDPGSVQGDSPAEIRRSLAEALDSYPAYRDQARTRLAITTSLIGQIADQADQASEEAAWRAVLLLGLALLGFAVWLVLAMLVRRSVVRPVVALTGAARQVAEVAERELARVADDDAEDDGPPRLRAMPVTARDEIGELAETFNQVQTTAAALLERQVLSRRNVAEMFGNVGRRVSNLTSRQLALIDAVERGATDPALLERLYSIDHIAVRLRRNADSLMLLAGIHEADLDAGPTALTNLVRASLGQIEGYQRVELRARTEAVVEPEVIGDLTLMVAELLENAVSFSPEGTPVEVTVADGEHGDAVIVVADHGLGMSPERLDEENARLIRRERLDLVPTKVLGLFVVGTLARRWEIAVTLSRTPGGGVTAEVTVPSSLLVTGSTTVATATAALAALAGGAAAGAAGTAEAEAGGDSTTKAAAVSRGAEAGTTGATKAQADSDPTTNAADASRSAGTATTGATKAEASGGSTTKAAAVSRGAEAGTTGAAEVEAAGGSGTKASLMSDGRKPRAVGATQADGRARTVPPTGSLPGAGSQSGSVSGPRSSGATRTDAVRADADGPRPLPRRVSRRQVDVGDAAEPATPGGAEANAAPASESQPRETPSRAEAPSENTSVVDQPGTGAGDTAPSDHRTQTDHQAQADDHARADQTDPLPRARTDRRSPTAMPRPGATPTAPPASGETPAARPLRRRVRGATLPANADASISHAPLRQSVRIVDAEAVRAAIEEFEAAVERAHRDSRPGSGTNTGTGTGEQAVSATPPTPRTQDQNDPPEGAEQ
ncbi:ATP-binding protein [Streptomyces sp. CA-251387]|uniref:sensor histidine kinase n=1 Tax=Streptomyces sp. CA-251387 TaxID=3240064 RepID=UPI003D93199C